MAIAQQGDVLLQQGAPDDGGITVVNGVVTMHGGLESAVYISLFGGNEDDSGADQDARSWWGNVGQAQKIRSATQYLLQTINPSGANLARLADAVKRDLAWLKTSGVASTVTARVTIPEYNHVNISVTIDNETLNFNENWGADMIRQFGANSPGFGLKTFGPGRGLVPTPYNPVTLFAQGQQGAIYDPSDLTTLWQDAAGTVPVTKSGDPVGLMRDKSGNGYHATQSLSASRLTYQTDGILHWLKPDGVDDFISIGTFALKEQTWAIAYKLIKSTSEVQLTAVGGVGDYRYVTKDGGTPIAVDNGRGVSVESLYVDSKLVSPATENNVHDATLGKHVQVWQSNRTSATATKTWRLGGYPSLHISGEFYGLVWRKEALTKSERLGVEQYLATKAGVTL